MTSNDSTAVLIAQFFEWFFPQRIGTLGLEAMTSFTVTFSFVITDLEHGRWSVVFENGKLIETRRVFDDAADDEAFSYHMNQQAFWKVVGGRDDPREVFLSGEARIVGDTEQALKVGMVLGQFTQQHPYPKDQSAVAMNEEPRHE